MNSWCDKLASTPTAGFKFDPYVASGDSLFDCLQPILTPLSDAAGAHFTIERHETFAIGFNTESGFRYGLDSTSAHVAFVHHIKAVPVSGGPPELKMLSTPAPYTELLPQVIRRLIEATVLLPATKIRKVHRIGIVSSTSVSEDELPPGILKFIEYMGRPWGMEPQHYNFNMANVVKKGKGWTDACVHAIVKPLDPTALLSLQFDWGRTFDEGISIASDALKSATASCSEAALAYFEALAEGSLFDERIISEPA